MRLCNRPGSPAHREGMRLLAVAFIKPRCNGDHLPHLSSDHDPRCRGPPERKTTHPQTTTFAHLERVSPSMRLWKPGNFFPSLRTHRGELLGSWKARALPWYSLVSGPSETNSWHLQDRLVRKDIINWIGGKSSVVGQCGRLPSKDQNRLSSGRYRGTIVAAKQAGTKGSRASPCWNFLTVKILLGNWKQEER